MRDEMDFSEEASARAIDHVHRLFIVPEIEKRLSGGTLDPSMIESHPSDAEPGKVLMPQITLVILEEEKPERVLFDHEAQVLFDARIKTEQAEIGQVSLNEAELFGFELPIVGPNAGWILVLNRSGRLSMHFDFRRNRGFAKEHMGLGQSFLISAAHTYRKGDYRACIEMLFHASEKFAKAQLLLLPLELRGVEEGTLRRKNHPEIRGLFEMIGQDPDGMKLIEDIAKLRNAATYFTKPFEPSQTKILDLLNRTKAMRQRILKRVPNTIADTPRGQITGEQSKL